MGSLIRANTDHATRNPSTGSGLRTQHVCVVGVGNSHASDDGIGPEIVRRLRSDFAASSDTVEFVTLRQAGTDLLDVMDGCDALILVDAVSSGAPAGTIHREEWQPEVLDARGIERASSHGLGVREMLELAAALNRLPARVILWGVEIASTQPEEGLTPAVAEAVPAVVAGLHRELEGLMVSSEAA